MSTIHDYHTTYGQDDNFFLTRGSYGIFSAHSRKTSFVCVHYVQKKRHCEFVTEEKKTRINIPANKFFLYRVVSSFTSVHATRKT